MKKKIMIVIFAILILIAIYYVRDKYLQFKKEKQMSLQEKLVMEMREKYEDIESFDDFYEGIKYVAYPEIFGYDLRLLQSKKPNLPELISLDELKTLYETSKVGIGEDKDMDMEFLNIMHKIYK